MHALCARRLCYLGPTVLRILDRYVIREVTPPFLLALLVFTFLLVVQPVMEQAEALLARGIPILTVSHIVLTLVPQALGIAIPVALLVGLLIGFGRLSGDREMVAMLAGGVSLYRLLRPVAVLAGVASAANAYVMIVAIPDANQTFREITFNVIAARAQDDVKPRVFFEDFPGKVLYARDVPESGDGWTGVFVADTTKQGWPSAFVAERGRLALDRAKRTVDLVLERGARHTQEEVLEFGSQLIGLDPETVFPRTGPQRGINEMPIADLRAQVRLKESQDVPVHNEVMAIQQKFSIPVACLVFGVIGLALGVSSRKDGKLAGFVLGLGVVFLYWAVMYIAEALTKGQMFPAVWSRWMANLVLGPLGVAALVWRARWADGRWPIRLPAALTRRRSGAATTPSAPSLRSNASRVVLVLRVPRVGLPLPNILDRYVAVLHVRVMAVSFAGLLGIFYIATFIDLSDKLFKGQASTWLLLQYFWYATPQFCYYVLPLSILISTLVTIGLLTKRSELTVMKACGISLYRAAAPLLTVGFVTSALLFGLQETVLGAANQRADALVRTIRGRPPRTFNPANPNWLVGKDGAIYHYTFFDPDQHRLLLLSIYRFDQAGRHLVQEVSVPRADYQGGVWVAQEGWSRRYRGPGSKLNAETERFVNRRLDLEPPDYFETQRTSAEMMTFSQLRRHVQELGSSGFNVTRYRVDLQRKVAFPFVTVIMTLLAVPFAVTTGRRGALYGVGLGIVLALIYWLLMILFAAIGSAGLLAPALAAWAPNLLFGAGAIYLILTART
mgnify:CR=1 FL=1